MPRIAFVGVDPRDRGGIAQFGANLAGAVREGAEPVILSYRRLYPSWSRAGGQPPDSGAAPPPCRTERMLVPWEPWTWLRGLRMLRAFEPNVVVLQWWSPLFGPCVGYLGRRLRAAGCRVVIVCHNDRPHEPFPFWRGLTRYALRSADEILTLSSPVAERIRALTPDARVRVVHHPPNLAEAESPAARAMWTQRIRPAEGPVILFFGTVRRYKGLDDLLAAMPLVRSRVSARLIVAGTFFEPVERVREYARGVGAEPDRDVRFFPGYVPSDEVSSLFALADVVALPYRSASQSGVLAQAARARRPVVATAVGGLPEAINGHGVVVPPGDPRALADGIVSALIDPPAPPTVPVAGWEEWRRLLVEQPARTRVALPPLTDEPAGSPRWSIAVATAAVAASLVAAVLVHAAGRAGLYGDAATHLLHGRRVFDSATPGFAQLGNYWPPLQHMLEVPFAWADPLYRSMWAGSLPAMAMYVLAVLGAYHLGVELVRDRRAGAIAAFAVGANPNLLYLQSSAMLESGIVMGLLWAAASLMRFGRTGRFADLVVAAGWSAVAVWTTWGALLLPFCGTALVVLACLRLRFHRRKIETFALAYATAAGFTLLLWLGWNFFIQGDALYVLHYSQPVGQLVVDEQFVHGKPGDIVFAVTNYGAAIVDQLGPVVTALMLAVGVAVMVRGRFLHPAGVTLLAAALVETYLLFRGTAIGSPLWADLKGLTSDESRNLNLRYGLWIAPFAAVAAAVVADRDRRSQLWVIGALVAGSLWFVPGVHGVTTLDPPAQPFESTQFEVRMGEVLRRDLAGADGRLLLSSINGGDRLIWRSRLDASRFVTEANGDMFERAVQHPESYVDAVFLAPGSSLTAALPPSRLTRLGFRVVWSVDRYGKPDSRYAIWRRDPS
jgi:D-inositol-3-phosphate glycosyltransferase